MTMMSQPWKTTWESWGDDDDDVPALEDLGEFDECALRGLDSLCGFRQLPPSTALGERKKTIGLAACHKADSPWATGKGNAFWVDKSAHWGAGERWRWDGERWRGGGGSFVLRTGHASCPIWSNAKK